MLNRIFRSLKNRINQTVIKHKAKKLPEYKNAKFLASATGRNKNKLKKVKTTTEKIWNLKEGEHAIIEGGKGEGGRRKYLKIKKIKQTKKGVIVEVHRFLGKDLIKNIFEGVAYASKRLVFYPKLEDAEVFARSSFMRRFAGPSSGLAGSVGTLGYEIRETGDERVHVSYIQSHFKQGEPKELTRGKASKYGGWKVHLIEEFFNIIPEKAGKITFSDLNDKDKEMFCSIAAKKGFQKSKDSFDAFTGKSRVELKRTE